MHKGLGARMRVCLRGWGVASELEGVAVRDREGVSKVEGVPTAVRRVVADAFGVVQWGRPVRAEADLVGPGSDGREVASRAHEQ